MGSTPARCYSQNTRGQCAGGYTLTCGHCLKLVDQKAQYASARDHCRQMDAHLVTPKTPAQASCVWDFVKNNTLGRSWVGADDVDHPYTFLWSDGTALPDDSPLWRKASNDPDHTYPGNNCVAQGTHHSDLYDEHCTSQYEFVCQKVDV
ncbi:hypothetical protein ACOMHN_017550 [Nucella lapillus]